MYYERKTSFYDFRLTPTTDFGDSDWLIAKKLKPNRLAKKI